MKNFFKSLFAWALPKEKPRNFGVLGIGDMKFYDQAEVVAKVAQAEFKPKNRSEWRTFFRQWQDGSSSCVSFTMAKILTVLYFLKTGRKVKFTPGFFYTNRANKPGEGMYFSDIVELASQGGLLYDLMPCEGMSEAQMNALVVEPYHKEAAKPFRVPKDWVKINPKDFNAIASTIEKTGKAVMIWCAFGPGEFFSTDKPKHIDMDNEWAHSYTLVDAFTFEGRRWLLAEDSADNEERYYLKLISEDFLLKKCYLAAYPINFVFEIGVSGRPSYDGVTWISLQKCLQYEGLFPQNAPYYEAYGPLTKEAVEKFQVKYGIVNIGEVGYGNFGPKTKAKVQELYP